MRLLAFSDLHRNAQQAERLVEMAQEVDVVIGAGDFANMRLGLSRTLDVLKRIETPTVLVPGNNESEGALRQACESWAAATILHGQSTAIDSVKFYGLGAAVPPTPFPWSWDISEEKAETLLAGAPERAVMVIHSPPYGHADRAFGRHLGSRAVLHAIEQLEPPLVICGHIHQCWGERSEVGPTQIINAGPRGTFLEL